MLRQGGRRSPLQFLDSLVGWRDPAKWPSKGKITQLKIGTESGAVWLLSFPSNLMSHCSGGGANGHNKCHYGAGWGLQSSHSLLWMGSGVGEIYFNSNTDLRREEKLENSDANPTFQEQHDCKYSLSRPKRQADYMHHVETFTNSINFFQALFLEVSLRCKVFHQRNVHFIGHLRAIISQIPPLAHPPSPKYSSTFSLS